jgi:hypothetical protein
LLIRNEHRFVVETSGGRWPNAIYFDVIARGRRGGAGDIRRLWLFTESGRMSVARCRFGGRPVPQAAGSPATKVFGVKSYIEAYAKTSSNAVYAVNFWNLKKVDDTPY